MKYMVMLLLFVAAIVNVYAAPRLMEIRTAADNVLVAVFKAAVGSVDEIDLTPSGWSINGKAPLTFNKYVMPADKSDHHIYLTTEKLVEGTDYAIHTPYGDTTITFNDWAIFCESIKTNQAAYSALAKNNYALFAIWLGDGGGMDFAGNPPGYKVYEMKTGSVVADGVLERLGTNASSGDTVYKIDLSEVTEGGPYKIAVQGIGCSYPFGVGGNFSKRLAYHMFRGQYYQRCGCPIVAPYGLDIRKQPCHTTVYKVNGEIGEANITVGSEESFTCHGGYHDAGDADRRAYHMPNPIINLMLYEVFPELFTDKQFNIPDQFDEEYNITGSGNGIPDIIDEALWGTLIWENLQNDDGSIQWGTETKGYPEPFEAPMDKDTKKYGTVMVDDRAAAVGAGLFMHLGRIIKPFDKAHSDELIARAEKSYEYVKESMADPEKLYYFIQKYLLTGDEEAHEQVKALKSAVNKYDYNVYTCNGYSLNDGKFDNPGYIMSYIIEKTLPTDTTVISYFMTQLKKTADLNVRQLGKSAYPVGNRPVGTTWGHNVMQPLYACAPLLYWKLTGDQSYFDGAAELMNYNLGLNPLGISYVTGLGFHRIHNPHDREFAYAKQQGLGEKPGITIFGPGVIQSWGEASPLRTWPELDSLPVERMFGDNSNSISTAEFTIFETMSHYSLYTVLANGGTWDDSADPYYIDYSSTRHLKPQVRSFAPFIGSCNGVTLSVSLPLQHSGEVTGSVYRVDGRKLIDFTAGVLPAGLRSITVPLSSGAVKRVAAGVAICRVNVDGKHFLTGSLVISGR